MISDNEYAQFSVAAYPRTEANLIPAPVGWSVKPATNTSTSGFAAAVFEKGNEIVISFTGTNEKGLVDFTLGNVPGFLGGFSAQILEAMALYSEIRKINSDARISFTGHSLGGGLASLMAVFFDEDAVVFDPAPFMATAISASALLEYKLKLKGLGYEDSFFNSFVSDSTTTTLIASHYPQVETSMR